MSSPIGIAQLSYLIGDDKSRTAAVIDPRPDVDVYLRLAREYGLSITHVFETHIHADFEAASMSSSIDWGISSGVCQR
jgi:hydroxyacylglutathione hydrolase